MQAKLLRVLQEREIVRFGDSKPRKVDVRVVAATNRDLEAEVKAGAFRSDLLYRLNVIPIRTPSLRERPDDIPTLVAHFLSVHARQLGVPVPGVTADAMALLRSREFPGNVRELENALVRALVMADPGVPLAPGDFIDLVSEDVAATADARAADGAAPLSAPPLPMPSTRGLLDSVATFERQRIEQAIAAAGGNRAQAARDLGISYRWLLKKLERYGVATDPS